MASSLPVTNTTPVATMSTSTAASVRCFFMRSQCAEMAARLRDGLIAVAIGLLAQPLLAVIQHLLNQTPVDFPPSVLAMAFVFSVSLLCGCLFTGADAFYKTHLMPAANLLNRHMSIGFTVPFVMVCSNEMASPTTVGLIIACFIVTGIINTITAYSLALPLQTLLTRLDGCSSNLECLAVDLNSEAKSHKTSKYLEDSSISTITTLNPSSLSLPPNAPTSRLLAFLLANPLLILSWTLTITISLPLRITHTSPTLFPTLLLISLWLTTLTVQTTLKTTTHLRPPLRTLLASLLNPVLFTSLLLIASTSLESALTATPLTTLVSNLQSHTTLSDLILTPSSSPRKPLAAGDIALTILNAGLVSWGLKLYEYRSQLLSRAGLTVFSVSSLLALLNVGVYPVLAHAMGLDATRSLAFAARSVTIAFGSPVMGMMGGDKGLNAAMVVVAGIVWQVGMGFVSVDDKRNAERNNVETPGTARSSLTLTEEGMAAVVVVGGGVGGDLEAQVGRAGGDVRRREEAGTVAKGVMVGINAAAMGTAYLYEAGSEAAPYSALSMMALGIMTVVFASIQPLAGWVVERVSG